MIANYTICYRALLCRYLRLLCLPAFCGPKKIQLPWIHIKSVKDCLSFFLPTSLLSKTLCKKTKIDFRGSQPGGGIKYCYRSLGFISLFSKITRKTRRGPNRNQIPTRPYYPMWCELLHMSVHELTVKLPNNLVWS